MRGLLMLAMAVLVSACSSGGGGDEGQGPAPGICGIVGSGSFVDGTTYTDPVKAFDGSLGTFATLGPAASASGTISGGGISGKAGELAGVAFTQPNSGSVSVTITTYKGGVPMDSNQAGAYNFTPAGRQAACPPSHCLEQNGVEWWGIDTLSDFDRIEAAISIANLDAPLQVRELCVN